MSSSEFKSMRIMEDNSAVCELVNENQDWRLGYQSIYQVAPALYELKDKLKNHLCKKTDDLFNITNRIAIFNLTNFYFESRKDNSGKVQFGRSKEKRSDCNLLVLALCINKEGFIRYSSILAGNTADSNSLPDMVETLNSKTRMPGAPKEKVLVCLDAGIATEENLRKIKGKRDNYLCVSRRRLTDYELDPEAKTVIVLDCKNQPIRPKNMVDIQWCIAVPENVDKDSGIYFLRIKETVCSQILLKPLMPIL